MRIVIIGGGVIGSAIAYFTLANPQFRGSVQVIERDPGYSRASSALSASSIRQQFSSAINIQIGLFGIEFLRNVGQFLRTEDTPKPDIGLSEQGYLFLATPSGAAQLRENHAVQRAQGAAIELLNPPALRARFPWLEVDDLALGAHGVRGEGWFDGYSLLQAFRSKAKALGAHYLHAEAIGFGWTPLGKINAVQLKDGSSCPCDMVVNAAGPWASTVAAWAGIDLPVRARRRCVFVFETPASLPNCPLVIDPCGVYFRPEGRQFLGGVSPDPNDDPDDAPLEPDYALFEERIWPALAARVIGLQALRQTSAWAGYYEMNLFDANGIVGRHPALENLIFANGFSGHGLQQSPAVGRGISELIVKGHYQTLDLSPLGFERIIRNQPLQEHSIV
jgi:FAD-dependent oxidoreductase domain-containing protein 1